MFEAIFRITAQVKSVGQGQRVFRVTVREAPANDAELLSRLATMYQQEVYSARPGFAGRAAPDVQPSTHQPRGRQLRWSWFAYERRCKLEPG